ncbi:hypothetical protein, partial [Legionella erythra]
YKIQQFASQYEISSGNDFPEKLKIEIKQFLDKHFELKEKKKTLQKLVLDDFKVTNYLELRSKKEKISGYTVSPELTRALVGGLNRIRKAIEVPIPLEEITTKDYAPQGTVYKLAKKIRALKPGERKQFVYYHGNKNHAIAFDVENRAGTLNIFCFDSSKDEKQLEAIDLLIDKLEKSKIKFEIKSCQAGIQKDDNNCSVFSILALKEFAKYDHVFDFLPEKYEEDEKLKKQNKASVSTGAVSSREVTLRNMGKVGWVKVNDMPTRIISMDQKYDEMKNILTASKQFDLDADKFCQAHKDYMEIGLASDNDKKLVNRKRKLIDERYKAVLDENEKPLFEKHLDNITELSFIKENRDLNIHDILKDKKSIEEKIEAIEKVFFAITDIYKIRYSTDLKTEVSIPDHVARAMLNLRNEFLTQVCNSNEDIKSKNLFTSHTKSILGFKLDKGFDKAKIKAENIPSAMDVFLKNMPNKGERRKFFSRFSTDDLQLSKMAMSPTVKEADIRRQIDQIEHEFGYEKNAKDDAFFQAKFMIRKFPRYLDQKVFYNLYRYRDGRIPMLVRKEAKIEADSSKRKIADKLAKNDNIPAYVYTEKGNLYYFDRWGGRDLSSKVPLTPNQREKVVEFLGLSNNNNKRGENYITSAQAVKLFNHNSWTADGSRKELLKILAFMLDLELDYLGVMYAKDGDEAIKIFHDGYYLIFEAVPRETLEETLLSKLSNVKKQLFFTLIKEYSEYMKGNKTNNNSSTKPSFIGTFFSILSLSRNHTSKGDENSIVDYYKKVQSQPDYSPPSFVDFSMSIFNDKWVVYKKSNLDGINVNKSDWKINLSIHQEDIVKALPIIAKIALDNNLGSFKVMMEKYAGECQRNKTMKGRELVIFCSANPNFDGEKFIQILSKIEEALKDAHIRNSTDTPPRSNRKLGYYSSYTHDAWTNDVMGGI